MTNLTYLTNLKKISHYPTKKFLIRVWKRIHKRKRDCIIAIVGGTGSGKSMIALTLANWLDVNYEGKSRFSLDRVIYSNEKWQQLMDADYPHGTVFILEEPEIYFNAKNYNTAVNKSGANKFNVGRFRRYIYLLTYPSFEEVDLSMRRRIHYRIDAEQYDADKRINYWRVSRLYRNTRSRYPPVLPARLTDKRDGVNTNISSCQTYGMSDEYYNKYNLVAVAWKKGVMQDKITSSGIGVQQSDDKKFSDILERRRAERLRTEENRRLLDLDEIHSKGLETVTAIKELVDRGYYYGKAHRLFRLIQELQQQREEKEHYNDNLDAVKERV